MPFAGNSVKTIGGSLEVAGKGLRAGVALETDSGSTLVWGNRALTIALRLTQCNAHSNSVKQSGSHFSYLENGEKYKGAQVAQSAEHPTLDLRVLGSSTTLEFCAQHGVCFSPSSSAPPLLTHRSSLDLSKINKQVNKQIK